MDSLILLAVVLVLHIWPVPTLQDPKRPRHSSLAPSNHPLRDIRVCVPLFRIFPSSSLTSQISRFPALASSSLLPEIQTHQQILGAAYVVRTILHFPFSQSDKGRLAPGIIVMQACSIFFPIYSTYRSRQLSNNTLSALRSWEDRTRWDQDGTTLGSRSTHTGSSSVGHHKAGISVTSEKSQSKRNQTHMMTISALEKAIATNPLPLLNFAATKDFTAENILFLISIRDWKAAWASSPPTPQSRAMLFNQAVEIYAQSVNEKLALFPINIEGGIRSRLDAIFESYVRNLRGESGSGDVVDPFNEVTPFAGGGAMELPLSPMKGTWPLSSQQSLPSTPLSPATGFDKEIIIERYVEAGGEIDAAFDEKVFDAAEKSIKYLVMTNTWRKMVTEMKDGSPRSSEETLS